LAGGLLAAPLAGEAQQAGKVPRIGYLALNPAANPHLHEAFRQGLRDLALRSELARITAELDRLSVAIAQGGGIPALPAALAIRDSRPGEIQAALGDLEQGARYSLLEARQIERAAHSALADWYEILERESELARAILGAALVGRLTFTAMEVSAVGSTGMLGVGRWAKRCPG
jgi:hypothetical protein